ncbi:MAG: hypothetical protein AAF514_03820 [Verrucomicrobiota bacterium]
MAWRSSNKAALATWLNLKALDQIPINRSFASTKDLKMKKLLFFTGAATPLMRAMRAETLANQIDTLNRSFWASKMEPGKTRRKAILEMKATLIGEDNTCADLGKVMDSNYRFVDE